MTREEAYNRIDAIIAKYEVDDEYVTITNLNDYEALRIARKTLEQEPILDKIKAEIEAIIGEHRMEDYDFCSGLIVARKIIDKHKESEE